MFGNRGQQSTAGPELTQEQFKVLQQNDPFFYGINKVHTQRYNTMEHYTTSKEIESYLSNYRSYMQWKEFIGARTNRVLVLWGPHAVMYVTHNKVHYKIAIGGHPDGIYKVAIEETNMMVQMQIRNIPANVGYYFIKNFDLVHQKDDTNYLALPYIRYDDDFFNPTRLGLIAQQGYPAKPTFWSTETTEKRYNDKVLRLLPAYPMDDPFLTSWVKRRKLYIVDAGLLFLDAEQRRKKVAKLDSLIAMCTCLATGICRCGADCKCTDQCKAKEDFSINCIVEISGDSASSVERHYSRAFEYAAFSKVEGTARYHIDLGGLYKSIPLYLVVRKERLRIGVMRFPKDIRMGYSKRLANDSKVGHVLDKPVVYIGSDEEQDNPFE